MNSPTPRSTLFLAALGLAAWALFAAAPGAHPSVSGHPASPDQTATQLGGRLVATWPVTRQAWPFEPMDIGLTADGRLYVADGASGKVLIYGRDGRLVGQMDDNTLSGSGELSCGERYLVPVALEIDHARDLVHVQTVPSGIRHGFNEAGPNTRDRACRKTYALADHAPVAMRGTQSAERMDLALLPDGAVLEVTWRDGSFKLGTVAVPPPWARVGLRPDGRRLVPRAESLEILSASGDLVQRFELPGLEPIAPALAPGGPLFVLARPLAPGGAAPVVVTLDPATGLETGRLEAGPAWPHPPRSGWPWALAANAEELAFSTVVDGQFVLARFRHDGQPVGRVIGGPARAEPLPRTDLVAQPERQALDLDVTTDGAMVAMDHGASEVSRREPGGSQEPVTLVLNGLDLASAPDGSAIYALSGTGHLSAFGPTGDLIWRRDLPLDAGSRVAADAGRVYVSLPTADRVLLLDAGSGDLVGERSSPGDGPLWPADLAAPGDGALVLLQPDGRGALVLAADGSETARLGLGLAGPITRIAARRVQGATRIAGLDGEGWVEVHEAGAGLLGRWPGLDEQGALVPPSDIALDVAGQVYISTDRVYKADGRARALRVYAPVADAPPPSPSPTPEARPTPSGTRCRLRGDKVAHPSRVMLGEAAAVTLTLAAECPGRPRLLGADVVLVVDRSASMVDGKIAAAQADATSLARLLGARGYRVSVVDFAEAASLASPLDAPPGALLGPLAALLPAGLTDVAAGLRQAEAELVARGRAEALPVAVLLSDAQRTVSPSETVLAAADALRARGITTFALGYGIDANLVALREAAGRNEQVMNPPGPADLEALARSIERMVADSLAGNWVIEDEMGADIRWIPQTSRPPAIAAGNRALWVYPVLPREGITLSYLVQPERVGRLPVSRQAIARFTDADGSAGEFVFPVPEIEVWQPTDTPTPSPTPTPTATATRQPLPAYLPLAQKGECLREFLHVVLALDTSSSMGVAMTPGGEPKIDAARRAIRALLGALRTGLDSAALVRFDRTASVLASGRDPAPLLAALDQVTLSSGTRIDLGLATARRAAAAGIARPGGQAVVLLLSDGDPEIGTEDATLVEAKRLLEDGTPVYTVAVGPDADRQLLLRIAGLPERSFAVGTGEELVALYRRLGQGLDACAGRR